MLKHAPNHTGHNRQIDHNVDAEDPGARHGGLKSHDVVAAVDVDGFAGDAAGEVDARKTAVSPTSTGSTLRLQRSALGVVLHHLAQVADAAGGQRLDGAGGDGVDADLFGAQARRPDSGRVASSAALATPITL